MWQALGVGAYNGGTSIVSGGGQTYHWTSASNAVNLVDTRVTPSNVDGGTLWVVWDSATPNPNVWVYNKVDSVVGDRCYFAAPKCTVTAAASVFSAAGSQQIASAIWGADTSLPASVQAALTTGLFVTAAATDIRPEDAAFAACRVNSALGASTEGVPAATELTASATTQTTRPAFARFLVPRRRNPRARAPRSKAATRAVPLPLTF